MKKLIAALFFASFWINSFAQENENQHRGTITVEKTGRLNKIEYDAVNFRLIGIDQYGNVLDSAVTEFKIGVTVKGVFYEEKTIGWGLSYKMQQLLGKCDQKTTIFFDNVKAKDRRGIIVDMPKFQYSLGPVHENNEGE